MENAAAVTGLSTHATDVARALIRAADTLMGTPA
jgi:hypothetical protein